MPNYYLCHSEKTGPLWDLNLFKEQRLLFLYPINADHLIKSDIFGWSKWFVIVFFGVYLISFDAFCEVTVGIFKKNGGENKRRFHLFLRVVGEVTGRATRPDQAIKQGVVSRKGLADGSFVSWYPSSPKLEKGFVSNVGLNVCQASDSTPWSAQDTDTVFINKQQRSFVSFTLEHFSRVEFPLFCRSSVSKGSLLSRLDILTADALWPFACGNSVKA